MLLASIKALIPTTWERYDGEVGVTKPTIPWVVWSAAIPGAGHQSESARPVAGDVTLTIRVAASSMANANLILSSICLAVGGRIPSAEGWSCGALVEYQPPRVDPTDLVIAGASMHLWQGLASWRTTVSGA